MTRVQQTAAAMLFVAVLILGGWAWSQDDPVAAPGDAQAGTVNPAVDAPAVDDPAVDDPAADDPAADDPAAETPAAETPAADPPTIVDSAKAVQPPTGDDGAPAITPTVPSAPQEPTPSAVSDRRQGMILSLWIFVLAVFLGIEVISKVPPTLHTPLMSGSNAISGITLVGAAIVAAAVVNGISPTAGILARFLGFIAVALAMINAVGGFLVTHRMLSMFTRK